MHSRSRAARGAVQQASHAYGGPCANPACLGLHAICCMAASELGRVRQARVIHLIFYASSGLVEQQLGAWRSCCARAHLR